MLSFIYHRNKRADMNKKTTENQIIEEEPEAEVAAEIAVDEDEK